MDLFPSLRPFGVVLPLFSDRLLLDLSRHRRRRHDGLLALVDDGILRRSYDDRCRRCRSLCLLDHLLGSILSYEIKFTRGWSNR